MQPQNYPNSAALVFAHPGAELGQRAGLGLDNIRAFSRHRTIATLMIYVDEHDRAQTQKTLGDLVVSTLTQ